MKKLLLYATTVLALTFGSCQHEVDPTPRIGNESFNLKVEIDNIGTGMQTNTRASIVDPVDGEEKVVGLYLLFFDASGDGSGKFKRYVQINDGNEITTGSSFAVNFEGANSGNYSILALANADDYFINSSTGNLQQFLEGLTETMSENDIIKNTMLYTGSSIAIDKLIMSGYTDKNDGEQLVTLKLTRGVVRLDVRNLDTEEYTLISASVYNKAGYTPLWLSTSNASVKPAVTTGKFYGIAAPTSGDQTIKGGLYTLENYTSNPTTGDNVTTCLVVGLRKGNEEHYYRVNINPEESGQSLKRNYVYQLTVRKVLGDGAESEDEAAASATDPAIDYDINNWNLDDEGIISTDGKNTLAIPSKIIRFAQEGGELSYPIYTDGEGTLAMSPSLPNGLSASLSGNTLTITAQELGTLLKREGTLEVSFAGLKGEVQVIQEPKIAHFLRLDQTTLRGFAATSSIAIAQRITINSSVEWTAKIYNTGGSHFIINGNSTGQPGQPLEITVDADNETNKVLNGFVLISLKDIPGYSRVAMLKQSTLGGISIELGSLTALDFKVNGAPKTIPDATSGDVYEFIVDPGADEDGNFHAWNAVLEGTHADKFELVVEKENGINRITVFPWNESATGNFRYFNLSSAQISGVTLKVYSGDNPNVTDPRLVKIVPVSQDALHFNVSGELVVPATGGERIFVVDLSEGLTWKATIRKNQTYEPVDQAKYGKLEHKGYLLDGSQKVSEVGNTIVNQSGNNLKFGFGKLLFPLVNIVPELEVDISVEQIPDLAAKTITLTQSKLLPRALRVLDITGSPEYGIFSKRGYFEGYHDFAYSSDLFGPDKGSYKCFIDAAQLSDVVNVVDPPVHAIDEKVNYLHAGSSKDTNSGWNSLTYTTLNNWRKVTDGIIVYAQDENSSRSAHRFFDNAPFNGNPYIEVGSGRNASSKLDNNSSNIMKYLTIDGPFGDVVLSDINDIGSIDDTHSSIQKGSVTKNGGIPIMTENNTDNILIFINPEDNTIFLGEGQLFALDSFDTKSIKDANASKKRNHSRFLANFISYVYRCAQYGSHFTDHFKAGSTTYPFDVTGVTKEPMYE